MDTLTELKKRAQQAIRGREGELRDLALRILAEPELGYQEVKASGWLSDSLAEAGFTVERNLGGLPTAFRASYGVESGPTIAFLAEYDALPEVGHGCGHNLIAASALGAAFGAAAAVPAGHGQIQVIGTPAEEYLGEEEGKIKLLAAGAFDGVDVALMLHPDAGTYVEAGNLGFIACDFVFHGRAAHAAADPWNGVNALDGLLLTFANINALRQQVRPEVRIHGIITDGGQAPNVIPTRAAASFMVRARDPETLEAVYERVVECARAGALASGAELEVRRVTTVQAIRVNRTLNELLLANCDAAGLPVAQEPKQNSGSTDFGSVSHVLPAANLWLETHAEQPWHTAAVAAGAGEEKALRAMLDGATVLAYTALDLITDSRLMQQVRADFGTKNEGR